MSEKPMFWVSEWDRVHPSRWFVDAPEGVDIPFATYETKQEAEVAAEAMGVGYDLSCAENAALRERVRQIRLRLDMDPHQWSKRPCETCRQITKAIGADFGCVGYSKSPLSITGYHREALATLTSRPHNLNREAMREIILSTGDNNLQIPCMVCEGLRAENAALKAAAYEKIADIRTALGLVEGDPLVASCAALREKVRELLDVASHTHEASYAATGPMAGKLLDSCNKCGLDLRHEVHAALTLPTPAERGRKP